MTEWVEQQICIQLCVKLENSSKETTWIIQKAVAMGNWWLVASSQQQCIHEYIHIYIFIYIWIYENETLSQVETEEKNLTLIKGIFKSGGSGGGKMDATVLEQQ